MIPLRLTLSNFLCYRENVPMLDFAGIHVACLCGGNGHGKSALLDSITWALWGKARGKIQDELISYGADECRVELDFSSRDQEYRIIRSHARGGKRRRGGASDLQLMVLEGDTSRPVTGNIIRETQARIDQTIGMDYDTFINSAFLVQGRADEFTNRTPAERKAVLGKILGLEAYDRLQVRAREGNTWATNTSKIAEGNVDRMRRELELLLAPSAELEEVEASLVALNKELSEQQVKTAGLRDQVGELRRQQAGQEETAQRLLALAKEQEQFESAHKTAQQQVAAFEKLVEQATAIREGAAQLTAARSAFARLEEAGRNFDGLERQRVAIAAAIAQKQTLLESQAQQLNTEIETRLNPKAQLLEQLEASKKQLQDEGPGLEEQERALAAERGRFNGLAVQVGQLEGSLKRFADEGKELAAKKELLNSANDEDAVCPLCQTPLSEDGCQRLAEAFDVDIQAKREEYRNTSAQIKTLQVETTELEGRLPQQEQALSQAKNQRQVRLQQLEQQIQESQQARLEVAEATPRLDAMRASLADGSFAAEESVQLQKLEAQIQELEYDPEARRRIFQETQSLDEFAQQERLLQQAEAGLPGAKETVEQNAAMAQRRKEELEQLQAQVSEAKQALVGLAALENDFTQAEQMERELGVKIQQAIERQGYLRNQVERKESLGQEVKSESARLTALQDEQSIYQELSTAFGRQGVQAMLIETVVPRLEDETNALLGRMTDNRMNVKLETQRERASGQGEPRETLEILVSDELGPRSYEMFSGGEAFRVNLALRIALSKVLAQRMGAPLPTLFIDEGFGTQDAVGRERILDVISVIGNDFEKVIVITHLDDLKEAFPVRIEVLKDEAGSTFWLS
ncbi:MAG: SMC family ATPase [SAR202 cluster bacterium]|nr:SMC family ATPase [SAR202 cluster bacterium]